MTLEQTHRDAYERSTERADSLLDRVNERLKETIRELHHGIEDEFGEADEMSDQERAVWEDLWWANRREQLGRRR